MNDVGGAVRAQVRADFERAHATHDLAHLDRVHRVAELIRAREGGDREIVAAASYLHDYHRIAERDGGGEAAAGERIAAALRAVDFPGRKVGAVLACIRQARLYSFSGHDLDALSPEANAVRDADNLDAMGAIGIARAFMYGAMLGEPMWVPGVAASARYRPGRATSIVHHFHEKLLRLRDEIRTPAGRELAAERHGVLVCYLAAFEREWGLAGREGEGR